MTVSDTRTPPNSNKQAARQTSGIDCHYIFMVVPSTVRKCKEKVSNSVDRQVRSLRLSGWNVTVGVVDDRTSFSGILRNIWRLSNEIADAKATLVHAQYGTVTAAIAHWIRGNRPLVVSFTGEDLLIGTQEPGLRWWLRSTAGRQISLFVARHADAIIVKSQNLKEALPARIRSKCLVLPNGVDMDFFAPMNRVEARSRLGWGTGRIVLFITARVIRRVKNLPLAEASVQNLHCRGYKATLMVISTASRQEILWMLNALVALLFSTQQLAIRKVKTVHANTHPRA